MGITQQLGASSLIRPGVIDNTAARPASPFEGQVIFQKDTDQLLVWNGTAWVIPNSPAQNPTGLELVTTTTCTSGGTASNGIVTIGSTVASVTVSTCFNSTYDSYRILINNPTGSTADGLRFALGGITTGVYYGNWTYALYNATALNVNPNNAGTNMTIGLTDTTPLCFSTFDLANPNTTAVKILTGTYFGRGYAGTFGCYVASSVQATSFVISNSSGTLTGGTIAVYGYRK